MKFFAVDEHFMTPLLALGLDKNSPLRGTFKNNYPMNHYLVVSLSTFLKIHHDNLKNLLLEKNFFTRAYTCIRLIVRTLVKPICNIKK